MTGGQHQNGQSACPALAGHEPMVRYCPSCGSIGPVEPKYKDCCPDGSDARMVPQSLAEKSRETFKVAIRVLLAGNQDAELVADAAEIIDTLTGNLPEGSRPLVDVKGRAKKRVAELYALSERVAHGYPISHIRVDDAAAEKIVPAIKEAVEQARQLGVIAPIIPAPQRPEERESDAEATLSQIAAVIQRHQAEGGISTRDAMSEIISVVESAPMQINTGHDR